MRSSRYGEKALLLPVRATGRPTGEVGPRQTLSDQLIGGKPREVK